MRLDASLPSGWHEASRRWTVDDIMTAAVLPSARRFAIESRASAGIELAIGSVALLAVAMLCFDLYSLVRLGTASARSATVMADYVSREREPDGEQVAALGQFLYETEFRSPADLVFVISAASGPRDGTPAEVLWSDNTLRIGDPDTTEHLAEVCDQLGEQRWRGDLSGMQIASGEIVVVAEVCAQPQREGALSGQLIGSDFYRLHLLPAREWGQDLAPPVYAEDT